MTTFETLTAAIASLPSSFTVGDVAQKLGVPSNDYVEMDCLTEMLWLLAEEGALSYDDENEEFVAAFAAM